MRAPDNLRSLGRMAATTGFVLLFGTTAAAQTPDTEQPAAAERAQQPASQPGERDPGAIGDEREAAAIDDEREVAAADRERDPDTPAVEPEEIVASRPRPAEETLRYEREYFHYDAAGRRDPFTPLLSGAGFGPRFEELELRGIIFSRTPGASVVLLVDPDGVIYRARRGEMVGNARVVDIASDHVRFAVDNYGIVRSERLNLKLKDEKGGA